TPDGSTIPNSQSPGIIPDPSEGRGPVDSGDPGGSEQLALFGVLVLAIVGIGFVVFRGGRKAQANRAIWLANADEPERADSPPAHPTGTAESARPGGPSDSDPVVR